MLTVKEVENRVELIKGMAHDPDVAHGEEDQLRLEVLQAIVAGHDTPAGLAKAALKTGEIDFPRWTA